MIRGEFVSFNEFEVGDIVTVVDEPYYACPFSWANSMNKYVSRQAIIKKKVWNEMYNTYMYSIDIDNFRYAWCGNCFHAIPHSELSDVNLDDIASLLFG